jgi:hypothetical protein
MNGFDFAEMGKEQKSNWPGDVTWGSGAESVTDIEPLRLVLADVETVAAIKGAARLGVRFAFS